MPIYEYRCDKCGDVFELLRGLSESDDTVKCPKCGAKKPKRLLSMFGTAGAVDSCAPSSSGISGGG